MSDQLDYLKERFDNVLEGQRQLAKKLDRMRDEQVTQRAEITATNTKITEHNRILVLGNGQKPLTVQVAEANTRLEDVENDVHIIAKKAPLADTTKEKLLNWGKVITVAGLVVNAISQYFMGG